MLIGLKINYGVAFLLTDLKLLSDLKQVGVGRIGSRIKIWSAKKNG